MFNKKIFLYTFFVLFFVLYVLKGMLILDPDFGWHLRMGELIIHQGIPKSDPFSYTMPSFPFIDHEWLTDVIIAFLFNKLNFIGLSVFFGLFPIAALFIIWHSINKEEKTYSIVPLLLAGITFVNISGIRPQVITLFFLAVQLSILKGYKGIKQLCLLSILFLLWVNLHGGFAIGIFVLFIVVVTNILDIHKARSSFLTFCVCFSITFINPYGIHIWEEILRTYSDTSLHWHILEWQPALFFTELQFFAFWTYLAVSIILILRYRRMFTLVQKYIFLTLLLAAISSIRNTTIWMVASADIFTKGIYYFSKEAEKRNYGKERFQKAYYVFVLICSLVVLIQVILQLTNVHFNQFQKDYPQKEALFLQKNLPQGNIFSTYNWGGYLIWKLPQKRVFIDGRMASWKRKKFLPNESKNAFADYSEIFSKKKALKLAIQKYDIKTFIIPHAYTKPNSIETILYSTIVKILHWNVPDYILYKELEKEGFKKVFQTDSGVIYESGSSHK